MREFAYLVRPAFDQAFKVQADERERGIVDEHWGFLLDLQRSGRLVLAGRCYDGPFGIVVFEAESEADARAVMERDPSVREGVQAAELYPFKVGLAR
jgi:uncharacterized protein YciI